MTENSEFVRKMVVCRAPSLIETSEALGQVAGEACRSYENSIINFLDRWLPDDDGNPKGTYYAKEPFIKEAGRWKGTDIIYAQQHVDFKKELPRAKALAKVKTFEGEEGRVVGNVVKDWVEVDGHPTLRMSLNICDPIVNGHWKAGKLSQSSAFDCLTTKDGVIVGDTNPDHLLVFVEDPDHDAMPRDPGTIINMNRKKTNCPLKSMEENHMPDKKQNAGKVLSGENSTFLSGFHVKLKELGDSLDGFIKKANPPMPPTGDGKTVPKEVPDLTIEENTPPDGGSGMPEDVTRKFILGADDETIDKMGQLDGLDISMVPEPLKKLLMAAKNESMARKAKKNQETTMPDDYEMTPEEKKKLEKEKMEAQDESKNPDEEEDEEWLKERAEARRNMANIQAQLKNQQAVIDDYKRKEAINQEKATRDGFEKKFLANIKPAYRDTPEKIETLYKKYKTDPVSLLNRMPEMHIDAKAETKREGLENVPFNAVSLANSAPNSTDRFTAGTPDGSYGYDAKGLNTYVQNIHNLAKAATQSKDV